MGVCSKSPANGGRYATNQQADVNEVNSNVLFLNRPPLAGDLSTEAFVEYAVRDYNKPMGVATYRTKDEMPERLRQALPDMDDLKKLL